MASGKPMMDLAINGGILAALGLGAYFAYNNNFFGIRDLIAGVTGGIGGMLPPGGAPPGGPGGIMPGTPAGYPTNMSMGYPTTPLPGQLPNPVGFEQGFTPGGTGPIPGGAPGIDYNSAIYDSPFGTPAIDPITGIDYSLYYPPTGVGTLPGTNPAPYPNPCLPGYYRAQDQKCYPVPTEFPGQGCGVGMYLASDGRCFPYPGGEGMGQGGGGVGTGNFPVQCPIGQYRAGDGKCYPLPSPPPESCPGQSYRASDGKCYPIVPGVPVGDCPTGYSKGSDGVCRATTACPTGHTMNAQGICIPNHNPCPTGYNLINGVCQPNITTCPTGHHLVNGVCVPDSQICPTGYIMVNGVCVLNTSTCPAGYVLVNGVCTPGTATNIPITSLTMIKVLPAFATPTQYTQALLNSTHGIETTAWYGVMLRPELSGGFPQYAVIIKAKDNTEFSQAMSRLGFSPLTADILARYVPIPGSFAAFAGNVDAKQVYNRRILNRYR
jgi:hypothetical protein